MKNKRKFYAKIIAAQLVALVVSTLLIRNVFLGQTPIIQAEFKQKIASLPRTIASKISENLNARSKSKSKSGGIIAAGPWVAGSTQPQPRSPTSPPTRQSPEPTKSTGSGDPTPTPFRFPNFPNFPTFFPPQRQDPTSPVQPTSRPRPTRVARAAPTSASSINTTRAERETVRLINDRRKQAGLRTLSVNSELTRAARAWSKQLANTRTCRHIGSDGSTPATRARAAGYRGAVYGETVGCGYRTASAVVDGWWKSPGHKAILTGRRISVIGVGWSGSYQAAVVGY